MYSDLLSKVQSNSLQPREQTPVSLKRQYPKISYWTLKDWNLYKATARQGGVLSPGDQVAVLDFIESEDGVPVSPERINSIRRAARELFVSIQAAWESNKRPVPGSWGLMSHGNKEFFREKMKGQFPELGFCEGDWKCEQVGTQTYSGWYRTHGPEKVKQEPGAKRQSKKMTSSSKSSTPALDNTLGRSHLSPTPIPALTGLPEQPSLPSITNSSTSIPISDVQPHLYPASPTGATLSSIASPVAPIPNLVSSPLDLDSPTTQGADHDKVLNTLQDPMPTRSPTPFSEPQPSHHSETPTVSLNPTPLVSTNTLLGTTLSQDLNQLPLNIPSEITTPGTLAVPLEHETTPIAPIQVRFFSLRYLLLPTENPTRYPGHKPVVRSSIPTP